MHKVIIPIIIAFLMSLLSVAGDSALKIFGRGDKYDLKWFLLGAFIYGATAIGWVYAIKHIKLSLLGVFYGVSTVILCLIIGVFYFHEKINLYEGAGIAAAIISIILLGKFA